MYSESHKFLYVHIPKTAGTSVQTALLKYVADAEGFRRGADGKGPGFDGINARFGLDKHASYDDYARTLGRLNIRSSYVFACIRNPWDRAISRYYWDTKGEIGWDKIEFIRRLQFMKPLPWYMSRKYDRFFHIDYRKRFNKIMRYETLAADFGQVCDDIGIPREPLQIRNKVEREHYSRYYDADLRDRVARQYQEEIKMFGYDFEQR
jgi:hypothetical protein